ncbi:glycosyltransferase family 4 protein [Clostridium thermosuccinogenes]|uniref:glycosyltransferase family 4 protein n=1 Tax=Clostridium thermosuccinogenes TaxID=84032 RepID=UPI000CCC6CFF|nr:glycosyltransferase family 4 protein [Pseudoclostridium thermosuccinogenes]PNT91549.1 hypothetical protein CDQ83_17400 [Pseudoclostridium thermosuccinogenes]
MKILYITPPLYGFWECLFEGATEINGLPSFNKPLRKLIESGHKVDFVLLHNIRNLPKFNIKASWLNEQQIKACLYYENKLYLRIPNILKNRRVVRDIIQRGGYDFVYGHGSATEIFRTVAQKQQVPFGQRLYGTFMWDSISKNGYIKTVMSHFIEYLSFKTKKSFLLVTNDGSRGDLVYEKINKKTAPYDFYYWVNGVNYLPEPTEEELHSFKASLASSPFIFYVARFDEWKRQERAVRILKALKDKNVDIHLYLAGPPEKNNPYYFNYVMKLISDLNLEDSVTYMGNINSDTINKMCKLSVASLSLYDVCNLTNVFHEMLAAGAVVIVKNDGVVNDFIRSGENGFLVNDEDEAVTIIERLITEKELGPMIRKNAIATSKSKMKTWDERINDEIDLIKRYVNCLKDVER